MHLSFDIHKTMRSIYQTHVRLENVRLYQNNENKMRNLKINITMKKRVGLHRKKKKTIYTLRIFFNTQNKIKKKNPKNEEGKSKYMYGELLRKHLVFENKRC